MPDNEAISIDDFIAEQALEQRTKATEAPKPTKTAGGHTQAPMVLDDYIALNHLASLDVQPAEVEGLTPEERKKLRKEGSIGFWENVGRSWEHGVPGVGETKAIKDWAAVQRLEEDSYEDFKQRDEDVARISERFREMEEESVRGVSVGGLISRGLVELPWFMVQFGITGGAAAGGKLALNKAIAKAMKTQMLNKLAATKAGKVMIKATAGTLQGIRGGAIRTALAPNLIAEATAERQFRSRLQLTEKGMALGRATESTSTSVMKGAGDIMVEMFSEASGPLLRSLGIGTGKLIGKGARKAAPEFLKHKEGVVSTIPAVVARTFFRAYKKMHPDKTAKEFFTKIGFDGFIEELGEERVGGILRAIFNLESIDGEDGGGLMNRIIESWPSGDEFLVEAGIMAVPSTARIAAGQLAAYRKMKAEKGGDEIAPPPQDLTDMSDFTLNEILGLEGEERIPFDLMSDQDLENQLDTLGDAIANEEVSSLPDPALHEKMLLEQDELLRELSRRELAASNTGTTEEEAFDAITELLGPEAAPSQEEVSSSEPSIRAVAVADMDLDQVDGELSPEETEILLTDDVELRLNTLGEGEPPAGLQAALDKLHEELYTAAAKAGFGKFDPSKPEEFDPQALLNYYLAKYGLKPDGVDIPVVIESAGEKASFGRVSFLPPKPGEVIDPSTLTLHLNSDKLKDPGSSTLTLRHEIEHVLDMLRGPVEADSLAPHHQRFSQGFDGSYIRRRLAIKALKAGKKLPPEVIERFPDLAEANQRVGGEVLEESQISPELLSEEKLEERAAEEGPQAEEAQAVLDAVKGVHTPVNTEKALTQLGDALATLAKEDLKNLSLEGKKALAVARKITQHGFFKQGKDSFGTFSAAISFMSKEDSTAFLDKQQSIIGAIGQEVEDVSEREEGTEATDVPNLNLSRTELEEKLSTLEDSDPAKAELQALLDIRNKVNESTDEKGFIDNLKKGLRKLAKVKSTGKLTQAQKVAFAQVQEALIGGSNLGLNLNTMFGEATKQDAGTAQERRADDQTIFRGLQNFKKLTGFDPNKAIPKEGDVASDIPKVKAKPVKYTKSSQLWKILPQQYDSSGTSINSGKPPRTLKLVDKLFGWVAGTINVDLGGGKFDNLTEELKKRGVISFIMDPFNRTKKHNDKVIPKIKDGQADTATINSVLNVIKEKKNRDLLIRQAANAIKQDGVAYFLIHQGSGKLARTGIGAPTTQGWQNNKKSEDYRKELEKHFNSVVLKEGNLFIATQPKNAGLDVNKVSIKQDLEGGKLKEKKLTPEEKVVVTGRVARLTENAKVVEKTIIALEKKRAKLVEEGKATGQVDARIEAQLEKLMELADTVNKVESGQLGVRSQQQILTTPARVFSAITARVRETRKLTLQETKEVQTKLKKLINRMPLTDAQKKKFLNRLVAINTADKFQKELPKLMKQFRDLVEENGRKKLLEKMRKDIERNQPKKKPGKKPTGKFGPGEDAATRQARLISIAEKSKLSAEEADEKIIQIHKNADAKAGSVDAPLSLEDAQEVADLQQFGGLDEKSLSDLQKSNDWLSEYIRSGKDLFHARREAEEKAKVKMITDLIRVIQGDSPAEATDKVKQQRFKALMRAMVSGGRDFIGWEDMMDFLSQDHKTSDPFDSLLSRRARVNAEETKEKHDVAVLSQEMVEMLKKAYGLTSGRAINTKLKADHKTQAIGEYTDANGKKRVRLFVDEKGKEIRIELTRAEARKMWMEFQDPLIRDSLVHKNGGYQIGAKTVNGFTQEMQDAIFNDFLTTEDKAFAKAQLEFYKKLYKKINKKYRDVKGVDLPFNEFYSPISRVPLGNDFVESFLSEQGYRRTIDPSFTKDRSKNYNKVRAMSDIEVMQRHVMEMAHFINWADKIRELNNIFNNTELRNVIESKFGAKTLTVIDDFVQDFTAGGRDKTFLFAKALNKLRTNFTLSALGLKASVGIKQTVSIFAFAEFVNNPVTFVSDSIAFFANFKKNYAILDEGGFLSTRGVSISRDIADITKSREYNLFKTSPTYKNFLLLSTRVGDKLAILGGGWAVYQDTLRKTGDKKKALAKFHLAAASTQQSGDLSQLSRVAREGAVFKLLTMFTSAQNQYLRREMAAWRPLIKAVAQTLTGNPTAVRGGVGMAAKRIFLYHFFLPMLFQYMSDFGQIDEEEQLRAAMLGSFNGYFIFKDLLDWSIRTSINAYFEEDRIAVYDPQVTPVTKTVKELTRAIDRIDPDDIMLEDVMVAAKELGGKVVGPLTGQPIQRIVDSYSGYRDIIDEDENKKGTLKFLGWSPYHIEKVLEED